MPADNVHEKRKHGRIPLFEHDGVFCIVFHAKSAHDTIALAVRDYNESGFRFAVDPLAKDDFLEGEKLYLRAISGSRNLNFRAPVELRIRWQRVNASADLAEIGCEIFNITARAKQQFTEFILAEQKFRGLNGNGRPIVRPAHIITGRKTTATDVHQDPPV